MTQIPLLLPPARRGLSVLRLVALLLLLALVSAGSAGLYLLNHPQLLLEQARKRLPPDVHLAFDDLTLLPPPAIGEGWRLELRGLELRRGERMSLDVHRAVLTMPRPWETGSLRPSHLLVEEPVILVDPSKPRPDRREPKRTMGVARVEIKRGSYQQLPGPNPQSIAMTNIAGEIEAFRFGPRGLQGLGSLTADSLQIGDLLLEKPNISEIVLQGETVQLAGAFGFIGSEATMKGTVEGVLHPRPASVFEVHLSKIRLEKLVSTIAGKESSILGNIEATLRVEGGGELPPGGGRASGEIRLTDGEILLAKDVSLTTKALLSIAPWIDLKDGRILLSDATAYMRVQRGEVVLEQLLYHAPKRDLELRGTMTNGELDLLVRALPKAESEEKLARKEKKQEKREEKLERKVARLREKGKEELAEEIAAAAEAEPEAERAGVGVFVSGRPGELEIRLAKPEEILALTP